MEPDEQDPDALTDMLGGPAHGTSIPTVGHDEVLQHIEHSVDVLVWFTTRWCGPCGELAPRLEEVARRLSHVLRVVAVDGDENSAWCERLQVEAFPTLALFHRGARVWQRAGAVERSADKLAETLGSLLDAVEGLSDTTDRSPTNGASRARRAVSVPDAPLTVLQARIRPSRFKPASDPLTPGRHDLAEGERLEVTLHADHRLEPPLDFDVLDGFDDDSIDSLQVFGAAGSLHELVGRRSTRSVDTLVLVTGRTVVSAQSLEWFTELTSLWVNPAWPVPSLPRVLVNDLWVLPELRAAMPADPLPADEPLIGDGGRVVHADDFDAVARTGIVLVAVTSLASEAGRALSPILGEAARTMPEVPVLAMDVHDAPAVRDEFDISISPTVLILKDGRLVWRTETIGDGDWLVATLLRALGAAHRPGAASLPMPRKREHRTLRLPHGDLPFGLSLKAPLLDDTTATEITQGGEIDVPAGWDVRLSVYHGGEDAPFDWACLGWLRDTDVDSLLYVTWHETATTLEAFMAALSRLSGLRHLTIASDRLVEDPSRLLACLTGLRELRVLVLEPYSHERPLHDDAIEQLRTALPSTVINGEWNGLPERGQPRSAPHDPQPST